MVQIHSVHLLGAAAALFQLTAAHIASPAEAQALITPFPRSPFAPDSPYYGALRRDDKDKDKDKDKDNDDAAYKPTTTTADFDKGQCGLVQDNNGGVKNVLSCSGDNAGCVVNNKIAMCVPDKNSHDDVTPLVGCLDDDSKISNDQKDDDAYKKCTMSGKKRADKKMYCLTYTQTDGDKIKYYDCTTSKGQTINFDTKLTIPAAKTSSSSSTTSTSSSSSSSTGTTTSASSTSASATSTPTAAPANAGNIAGLPAWAIALASIGSILGALAIVLLIYHFISSKVKPDDEGDSQPLVESKQWKGPWQGRGAE